MNLEQRLDCLLSTLFRYVEKTVLLLVGGLALIAIGQLTFEAYANREVRLEDLLMIFIFIEIMAMANVYFVRHAVPFTFPMFIAVTALARLVVLQGKDIPITNLLYEGIAILLISLAILTIRFSRRYSHENLEEERSAAAAHPLPPIIPTRPERATPPPADHRHPG